MPSTPKAFSSLFNPYGISGPIPGGPMVSNYSPIYGGVPGVPDPTKSAATAISGDIANLPNLQHLAASTNFFNQAQAEQGLETAIPGFAGLNKQSSANIAEELAGEVPGDVVNELLQGAAERGILTGSPGSPNSNAAYLRALGLTSLGQKEAGQKNLSAAVARAPQVPLFNLASLMTSPEQVQDADLTRNIYASAPVPEAAGRYAEDLYTKRMLEARKFGMPSVFFGSGSWNGTQAGTPINYTGVGDSVPRGV